MPNQKILVTGAAGFVGGHTSQHLLRRGDDVVAIDNLNSYYDNGIKFSCLDILRATAREEGSGALSVYVLDICDKDALKDVFEKEKPDIICHLAAQAGVRYSIEHLDSNITTNIVGTINLFQMAREYNVKNVVAASSSSVYGKESTAPFSEDQRCDTPISPYAATKRSCELFGYTFHHLYKLNITMLRFFTVYGPRGRPDMAAFKFINSIYHDKPIDKYGDGSSIREFTFVDDIVAGVIGSIDRVHPWLVVNLGGGSTNTLNELIATIEKHLGKKAIINQLGNQPGDVSLTSADQTVAKQEIGFEPKVNLDEGIRRTVEWYKQWIQVGATAPEKPRN